MKGLLTTFAISLPGSPLLAYLALAGLVGSESSGVPLPGETALFLGSFAAHDGKLSIVVVIAVAAAAAIVGDNIGYLLGRRFGRRLLTREGGRFEAHRRDALDRGERFFARHGSKAVFLGRWVAGLRVWASWIAGMTHLPWPTFLVWNALGGILWAITVGLLGYLTGHAAEQVVQKLGYGVLAAVVVAGLAAYFVVRRRRTA